MEKEKKENIDSEEHNSREKLGTAEVSESSEVSKTESKTSQTSEEKLTETHDLEVEIKKETEKEIDENLNPAKLLEENMQLKSEIKDLKEQVEDFKRKWIYVSAEYENYRKRVKKEIEIEVKNQILKVLKNFIEAIDSIDSALKMIQDENTRKGIEIIKNIIENALLKSGAKEIQVKEGDEFDPSKCEAIETQISEEEEKDKKISKIVQRGFEFNGNVIRPVKVVVWKYQKKEDEDKNVQ